jgi:hypothetical protein
MVVRNMERFVGEAIESILNQTFRDFEFVIVDFGSTDRSPSIISSYQAGDSRIKLQVIPPCSLAEARNASCALARGRYIALMDADDMAFPDRLERQVAYLDQHPEIALVGGALECFGASGAPCFIRKNPLADAEIRAALPRSTQFFQNTVVMRREVMSAVKGYRKAFAVAEDYDLWLRVAERFPVANLAEPLVRYRIHPEQVGVRTLRLEVMSCLAAQASAQIRARGGVDPLWQIDEITPEVLTRLGVNAAALTQALAEAYGDRINLMLQVCNEEAALALTNELLELSHSARVDGAILSSACLTAARIHYQRGSFLASLRSVARAIRARPVVVGRPIKNLLHHASAVFTALVPRSI